METRPLGDRGPSCSKEVRRGAGSLEKDLQASLGKDRRQ